MMYSAPSYGFLLWQAAKGHFVTACPNQHHACFSRHQRIGTAVSGVWTARPQPPQSLLLLLPRESNCCLRLLLPAGGANETVRVTCTGFAADFSVTLTATASAPGAADCVASDSDTVDVAVNIQPAVSIVDVSEATSFCSPDGPLTFTYNVSSGPANTQVAVSLDAPAAAGCVLSNTTGMSAHPKGFSTCVCLRHMYAVQAHVCYPINAGPSHHLASTALLSWPQLLPGISS